jgi:hypothetical protein
MASRAASFNILGLPRVGGGRVTAFTFFLDPFFSGFEGSFATNCFLANLRRRSTEPHTALNVIKSTSNNKKKDDEGHHHNATQHTQQHQARPNFLPSAIEAS